MTGDRTAGGHAHLRRLALGCALLAGGTWLLPAQAKDAAELAISVAEPEGFADLAEAHTLLVDVYFGGVRRGEARISAAPGAVSFLEPVAALDLLPELTDRQAVEAALTAESLPANAQLACSGTTDPARCGRLSPEVAGVIFDRDSFRIDVFVNPRFLAVRDTAHETYLPEPPGGPAMINTFGAVLSGKLGTGTSYHNLQDQLLIGSGARRLRADLFHASEHGFGADRLALEWDRPDLRYSAGALWAPGNQIGGRRKLIGFGIESQIDTRLDKDEILGSPLVVYLEQRARVDIVRDGRVLASAIHEAGNRQLDTSSLPDGSYDVVLRIEEPGRPAREERRFFTKSRRIPSLGRTDFFAFGGLLVDAVERGSLEPSSHPYVQGGIAHRLGEKWALAGAVEATDGGASGEVAATYLTPLAQLRAAAVADLNGAYGAIVQVTSGGMSRLNFNFDLRVVESAEEGTAAAAVAPPPLPALAAGAFAASPLAGHGGSYAQAGGIVSYSLASLRFLGTFFYRDDDAGDARYSVGPALEWDVLRRGPFTVTLRGDMTATERGTSGFAGASLRLIGSRSTLTALGGARASGLADDELGEGLVAALAGAWSPSVADGDLALGAGFEHQPRQDNAILSADFRHAFGSLSGDLVHTDGPFDATTQYSLGFQTTVAAGAGAVRLAGRTTTESLVVARVSGARESDRFDLLANEQLAGTIVGTAPFTLALPAYRAYALRIRPAGEGLLAYDSAPRSVSLYPGTVAGLDWAVAPITIKFGRLVSPEGAPIRGASIVGRGVWSETDDDGYFQIEAPDRAELTVTLRDGHTFATTLPDGEARAGIARLGEVVCCGEPETRLGALGDLPAPANGGSK